MCSPLPVSRAHELLAAARICQSGYTRTMRLVVNAVGTAIIIPARTSPLGRDSELEIGMTTQTYHEASRKLLAQARDELAVGDVRQASEKGWGAAAQMVKAVAEQRGWEHKGHGALFTVVDQVARETQDHSARTKFHVANSLHANFYEHWMSADMVSSGLDEVGMFIDRLEPLL